MVTITSPTSSSTYQTDTQALTVRGSASDDGTVSSVAWAQTGAATDSGSCSDTTSWSCTGITLGSGSNVITVTATDDDSDTGTDVLTVTYPIPTITSLQGVAGDFKYN